MMMIRILFINYYGIVWVGGRNLGENGKLGMVRGDLGIIWLIAL